MKYAASLLLFSGVLIAQTPTNPWPQEPTGFKNLPFGSSRKVAASFLHLNTGSLLRPKLDDCSRFENTPCVLTIDAGGFKLTVYLQFANKAFADAVGSFPSENYPAVREMFISLYGPPQDVKESDVQNRIGGTFKQETLHWNGNHAYVTLSHYGSTVTNGSFGVGLLSVIEAERAAQEAAKKKALQ